MKTIQAKIISNKETSPGYFKMRLDEPYLKKNALPGQFAQVRCAAGRDPLLRRPLGIHALHEKGIDILYEVVGKGTELLSRKKEGETLDVLGPLGNGFRIPAVRSQSSAVSFLIAGGIGVAPLVFLAEKLAEKKINTVVLIGARTKNALLCESEFKKAGAKVLVATDDGTKGHKGFVTDLFKTELSSLKPQPLAVYACGPISMLKAIAGECVKNNITCQVSIEEKMACGIGACLGCCVKTRTGAYKLTCKDGPVFDAKEIF